MFAAEDKQDFVEVLAAVVEAAKRVIDPVKLRWIGFSHFEVDECGSLNDWLRVAPRAQAVSGFVGSLVNLTDFPDRAPRALNADETFSTGKFRFRFRPTPHLPHGQRSHGDCDNTRGRVHS